MDAKQITRDLCGDWYGSYGNAPCPICQVEGHRDQRALTVRDANYGRLLMICRKAGCDFRSILAAIGLTGADYAPPDLATIAKRESDQRSERELHAIRVTNLWKETCAIDGTLAELYLRNRGISCLLPESLRFHHALWHSPTKEKWPAMVARIDGGAGPAIHRTYLRADGSGKIQHQPAKLMLGRARGGAVKLSEGDSLLVVAEGIETALSLASGLLEEPASVWAALSTSGMVGLRLPISPGHLLIAQDNDDAGRKAAFELKERAITDGWTVQIAQSPIGNDWNDFLKASKPW